MLSDIYSYKMLIQLSMVLNSDLAN